MQSQEIHSAWKRMIRSLENVSGVSSGFLTEPTGTTLSNGPARLGVSSDCHVSLLIPAGLGERIEAEQKTAFISISSIPLVVDGSPQEFINVLCDEPELVEVFAKVVGDILQRLENGHSSPVAIDDALKEFRRLLRLPSTKMPEIGVVAGLVGELVVLIELLEENDRAWQGWHGPGADRHDFRAGGISMEIKTSLGADGRKVLVHGIRQLEESTDGRLILKHIRLEPDPAGELRVPTLARLATKLASDPRSVEAKLLNLGFDEQVADAWGHYVFTKYHENAYEVSEGFPRIVPKSLAVSWPISGVSAVSYELDLGAAGDFVLPENSWNQLVRDYCACL